MCNISTVWLVR